MIGITTCDISQTDCTRIQVIPGLEGVALALVFAIVLLIVISANCFRVGGRKS
jgi:hypothetical protein